MLPPEGRLRSARAASWCGWSAVSASPRVPGPQRGFGTSLPLPLCDAAPKRETRYLLGMPALKARVENGRLTLSEPTDLPEGTVVPLEIADDWDDLDDEERAALHASIREGIEDMEAGRTIDARTAIAELRSRL
jgi:hypothetical protein